MGELLSKFCPVCGRAGDYPENVCPDCLESDETALPFEKEKERKTILKCKSCGRVKTKKRWGAVSKTIEEGNYRFKKALCPDCYKEGMNYYQAILRVPDATLPEKRETVRRAIETTLSLEEKRSKRTAITKVDEKKAEYYFTHLSTVRAIVRLLQKTEKIEVREDAHLFGYDAAAGKGKYKVSVLVRFKEPENRENNKD